MILDGRRIAVLLAGFCAFINLYMPQALLPSLAREFAVGAAEISTIITASTLAIALTAPFTGALADVVGRKRVMTVAMIGVVVPTVMVALSRDVQAIVASADWNLLPMLRADPGWHEVYSDDDGALFVRA